MRKRARERVGRVIGLRFRFERQEEFYIFFDESLVRSACLI